MNIITGFMLYIELIKNIMILAHILIENPDKMCIKVSCNNQYNNDYTTRMTKYKFLKKYNVPWTKQLQYLC
jgi:hypothetical protein